MSRTRATSTNRSDSSPASPTTARPRSTNPQTTTRARGAERPNPTRQRIIRSTESGTGLGFRIRNSPNGGVELRSISRAVVGAVVAAVFGLPAAYIVAGIPLGLVSPSGLIGWTVTTALALIAGACAAVGVNMIRGGASTLTIQNTEAPITADGPKWDAARRETLYPRRLRALYGGRDSGHSDSGPRELWILALECDTDELAGVDDGSGGGVIYPVRLDTTRSHSQRKVIAAGNRIADTLGIPFADDTDAKR